MVHGDDLSIHDVEALSRAHVNSGIVLRYIRDHGTVYYLSSADIKEMQAAGVDAEHRRLHAPDRARRLVGRRARILIPMPAGAMARGGTAPVHGLDPGFGGAIFIGGGHGGHGHHH